MNLISFLEQSSNSFQNNPAIVEVDSEYQITYEELWGRVHKLSHQLINLGLHKDDKVILALPNSIDWIICFLACVASGATVVPLLSSATSFDIKRTILNTKPSLFIGDSSFINRALPFDLVGEGQRVVITNKKLTTGKEKNKRITKLNELIDCSHSSAKRVGHDQVQQSETTSINYTYRGYGYPVGAMLSPTNYIEGIRAYAKTAGFSRGERCLAIAPFCYIYPLLGCVLTPLYTGSTIVITQSISANKIWPILKKYNVNVITGTPSFYISLAAHVNSETDTSGIEFAFSGGSLLSEDQHQEVYKKLGIDLRQGYGLTECMPVTCNPARSKKPGSLGKILVGAKGIAVKVIDDKGATKPVGEVGEIAVSGPTLTRGYFQMEEQFRSICQNGWFLTGDLGYFDEEGYLFFSGLKKRITKVGGNMVDLLEVEDRILSAPGIRKARVYAVADDRWGSVVAADIETASTEVDQKKIKHHLKKYLASYKIPKEINTTS